MGMHEYAWGCTGMPGDALACLGMHGMHGDAWFETEGLWGQSVTIMQRAGADVDRQVGAWHIQ
eukprot:6886847-Heterocapsa_arctica.AAC.1